MLQPCQRVLIRSKLSHIVRSALSAGPAAVKQPAAAAAMQKVGAKVLYARQSGRFCPALGSGSPPPRRSQRHAARRTVRAAAPRPTPAPPRRPTPLHQAYVRCKPEEENLTISLVLGGRQRNLNRCARGRWVDEAAPSAATGQARTAYSCWRWSAAAPPCLPACVPCGATRPAPPSTLPRPKDEALEKPLGRIKASAAPSEHAAPRPALAVCTRRAHAPAAARLEGTARGLRLPAAGGPGFFLGRPLPAVPIPLPQMTRRPRSRKRGRRPSQRRRRGQRRRPHQRN
jgi:hypothetical protein